MVDFHAEKLTQPGDAIRNCRLGLLRSDSSLDGFGWTHKNMSMVEIVKSMEGFIPETAVSSYYGGESACDVLSGPGSRDGEMTICAPSYRIIKEMVRVIQAVNRAVMSDR